MAVGSLSSSVNEKLILRFEGVAQGSGNASLVASLKGQGSSTTTLSKGIRTGAKTYSTAVQALNSVYGIVNLSEDTLKKLGDVTDKLISITESATKSGLGLQARQKLDRQFAELGAKFKDIVAHAKVGDKEYLTKEGLGKLFTLVGLDPEQTSSLLEIFDKFILSPETSDDLLASDTIKGGRPVPIPPGAFVTRGPAPVPNKVSNNNVGTGVVGQTGEVTQNYTVSQSSSGGVNQLLITPKNGTPVATFSTSDSLTLLSTDGATGNSVIQSNGDYLGQNTGNLNQLFLVDSGGNVIHQFTAQGSAGGTFGSAAYSASTLSIAYVLDDGVGTSYIGVSSGEILGHDPTIDGSTTFYDNDSSPFTSVVLSDDGSHAAWKSPTDTAIHLVSLPAGTFDSFLLTQTNVLDFGFTDSNQLAVARDTDTNGTADTVSIYTDGVGSYGTTVASGLALSKFTTLEKGAFSHGYVAFAEGSGTAQNDIIVHDSAGTHVGDVDLGAGDSLGKISLAHNATGVDAGIFGTLTGDSDNEQYRVNGVGHGTSTRSLSRTTREAESLFDGTWTLTKRPDAYRILNDLKALKNQIEENSKNLEVAKKYLNDNIEISRAAGLGLLEIGDQLTSNDDAASVAGELRDYIAKNARGSLAQAHNLTNIAAAALLLSENGLEND